MPRPKMQRRAARPPPPNTYTREGGDGTVKRRTRLYEFSPWLRKKHSIELASVIDSPKEMNFYLKVYGKFLYYGERTSDFLQRL